MIRLSLLALVLAIGCSSGPVTPLPVSPVVQGPTYAVDSAPRNASLAPLRFLNVAHLAWEGAAPATVTALRIEWTRNRATDSVLFVSPLLQQSYSPTYGRGDTIGVVMYYVSRNASWPVVVPRPVVMNGP